MYLIGGHEMKIGILSMQRIINYGSFMQAYSLKIILEHLGHEVVFVDYRIAPNVLEKKDKKKQIKYRLKNLKRQYLNNRYLDAFLHKDISNRAIMRSCNQLLGLTDNYHYCSKVDLLIIGSDEVFNCTQMGDNVGYALELFGKNARAKRVITYAASFGYTTIEMLEHYGIEQEIGNLLKKISAISVRDENSYAIIEKLCCIKPYIHADPVLVGGIENMSWSKNKLEHYLIIYGYRYRFSYEECETVLMFARKRGLTVIALGEDQLLKDENIFCRPDEIIEYFRNADYVVTDTFHGTIFSVITHRKFLTVRRPTTESGGNSEKISSLVKQLHVENRLVDNLDTIELDLIADIDYGRIDELRERLRLSTLDYLQNQVGRVTIQLK